MATLTGKQLKDSYQSLVTIKDADDANPTSGQLENGLGNAITALGIGTDSPATALDVAGTITSDGQVTNGLATFTNLDDSPVRLVSGTVGDKEALTFERSGGAVKGSIEYQQSPIGFNIGTDTVHDFRIKTDGTERMKIKSDGDISFQDGSTNEAFYWDASEAFLGIGTVPATPLHVNATNANACIINVTGTSPNYIFDIRDDNVSQFRVDSSGNVGIGTTSPSAKLDINGATDTIKTYGSSFNQQTHNSIAGAFTQTLYQVGGVTTGLIGANASNMLINTGANASADIVFATGSSTTERMRIDSSGNVLVGKTASGLATTGFQAIKSGQSAFSSDGDRSLILNRKTSDGSILEFRKDESEVGSIGSIASDLYIAESSAGLRFDGENNQILPSSTTASTDNTCNLGDSGSRFKDLYLGGNVILSSGQGIDFSDTPNTTATGATMTSELLDDYEEGTWTPAFVSASGSFTTMTMDIKSATYTKIGRQVTVRAYFTTDEVSVGTASGQLRVSGLPFASAGSSNGLSAVSLGFAFSWGTQPDGGNVEDGQSYIVLRKSDISTSSQVSDLTTGATADQNQINLTATYFV